jgi:uncharacterized protein YdaU (DUF1376 family)
MAQKLAYFPFYPDDWISSPKVMMMTMEQRGIYITLLAHAWNFPGGSLPDDMSILQRFCHGARKVNIQHVLDICFVRRSDVGGDVTWTNPRLLHERSRAIAKHQNVSEASKIRENIKKEITILPKSCHNRGHNQNQNQNHNQNQNQKESKTIVQKTALNEGFKIFWKAYPKKQGREKARQKWDVLKPSAELLSEMLIALEQQKQTEQWRKDNGQFIPMPITWLNQKRWEDEVKGEENAADRVNRIVGVCSESFGVAGNVHRKKIVRIGPATLDGEAVEVSEVETREDV